MSLKEQLGNFILGLVLKKIELLKKQKENIEKGCNDQTKTAILDSRIKMLTEIAEGELDINKAEILRKGVKEIDQKIEELERRKKALQKELEKYPLTNSILMNLLQ